MYDVYIVLVLSRISTTRHTQIWYVHVFRFWSMQVFLSPVFAVSPLEDGFLEPQDIHVPLAVSPVPLQAQHVHVPLVVPWVLLQAQHVHALLEPYQGDVLLLKAGLG